MLPVSLRIRLSRPPRSSRLLCLSLLLPARMETLQGPAACLQLRLIIAKLVCAFLPVSESCCTSAFVAILTPVKAARDGTLYQREKLFCYVPLGSLSSCAFRRQSSFLTPGRARARGDWDRMAACHLPYSTLQRNHRIELMSFL